MRQNTGVHYGAEMILGARCSQGMSFGVTEHRRRSQEMYFGTDMANKSTKVYFGQVLRPSPEVHRFVSKRLGTGVCFGATTSFNTCRAVHFFVSKYLSTGLFVDKVKSKLVHPSTGRHFGMEMVIWTLCSPGVTVS